MKKKYPTFERDPARSVRKAWYGRTWQAEWEPCPWCPRAYRRPTARIWRYEVVNSRAFVHTRHSRITRRGAERLVARLQRQHQRRARRNAGSSTPSTT